MLNVLVVIINYKTPELVCQAVLSVIPQLSHNDKICIVDNFSNDDSVDYLAKFIEDYGFNSQVDLIFSPTNGGFSAGNNIGINLLEAKYYLLLNSDAYLKDAALSQLVIAMDESNSIGIVAPQLMWEDGRQQTSCFYNLTPLNSFIISSKTGFISRFLKVFGLYEVAIPLKEHGAVRPQWLSFACVLLRGEMIKDIGLMDDGYFMYREDNDYCRRAVQAGWKLKYCHSAKVVHLNQGDSNQKVIKRLPKYYFESRSRYFIKYYGRSGLFIANINWSLGRIISLARETIERKPAVFHKMMFKDIWIGFRLALLKSKNNEE